MPEGECWAASTDLGRREGVPSHVEVRLSAGRARSGNPILHLALLTIQSESVARHPIQRPLWGLEHS